VRLKKYEAAYVRDVKASGVELYVPKFEIKAINPKDGNSSATFLGYVDTGNDIVTLPLSVAQSIGINLQGAKKRTALGAGGKEEMPTTDVILECVFGKETLRVSCNASFSTNLDSYTPLTGFLGNLGFIEKFDRIVLYPKERRMELFME